MDRRGFLALLIGLAWKVKPSALATGDLSPTDDTRFDIPEDWLLVTWNGQRTFDVRSSDGNIKAELQLYFCNPGNHQEIRGATLPLSKLAKFPGSRRHGLNAVLNSFDTVDLEEIAA